jgi:hypothetical protein
VPVVLGVPIRFGVRRKALSLLMIDQAPVCFEVGSCLDSVQIMTFLLFLTFYVPCLSTFAVMQKKIGRRAAHGISDWICASIAGAVVRIPAGSTAPLISELPRRPNR